MSHLNIVLATDENYVVPTAVVISSIIRNNHDGIVFDFYVFTDDISGWMPDSLELLKSVVANHELHFISIDSVEEVCRSMGICVPYKGGYGVYVKLFMTEEITDEDPLVWLDSDVIVTGSLIGLCELNKDIPYYVCRDTYNSSINRNLICRNNDGFIPLMSTMVIHPKAWKNKKIGDRVRKSLSDYNKEGMKEVLSYIVNEQGMFARVMKSADPIGVLGAEYTVLPGNRLLEKKDIYRIWNLKKGDYYTPEELKFAEKNPIVIHYMHYIAPKPWKIDKLNPYGSIWIDEYHRIGGENYNFSLYKYEMNSSQKMRTWLFIHMRRVYVILAHFRSIYFSMKMKRVLDRNRL